MVKIEGLHNTAICFTDALDEKSAEQIKNVCDAAAFSDSEIRIMPDVHAGVGCTIGTTMTIIDKIVPGMVGVDIGCGMETVLLDTDDIDFPRLDNIIHKCIPSGRNIHNRPHKFAEEIDLSKIRAKIDIQRAYKSVGTLGGGNHFIEIDKNEGGDLYLVIHSGSRHLGKEVAEFYSKAAAKSVAASEEEIAKNLAYLTGELFDDYIHDMKIIQQFAVLNRKAMIETILIGLRFGVKSQFTTIHNYIDTEKMILRKGSVSADKGEKLLIPINMRDGSLICVGKGNADWNFSAPHGAGRLLSRTAAKSSLSMEEYRSEMAGIYSTSVSPRTLDESPMAYKPIDDIIAQIEPTAEITERILPVYNFKA
jgi:RNA-splicing ligase RtcB